MRIYNKVSIISCNLRNIGHVVRPALALAVVEDLMVLLEELTPGWGERL